MSSLRERLSQMGETARDAAEPTFGGRWICSRERHDGTAHVYSPSTGPLRQAVPVAETNPIFGAHIATFSPDVAAALVAVAEESRKYLDTSAVPGKGVSLGEHTAIRCGDNLGKAIDALAAALGVSR